jgi:hypothetical protein
MHVGLVAKLYHPAQGGYTDPEEFIHVIGKDTKKADAFPQRYGRVSRFLQHPGIE